jgi:hypothetical protein
MNSVWNNFSADQQTQMMSALGTSELPDPTTLDQNQLSQIDTALGFGTSLQIIAYTALAQTDGLQKPEGTGTADTPVLDTPDISGKDGSDLTLALMELKAALGDLQINTAKEGVEANKLKMEQANAEKLDKIKECIEKMEKASKAGMFGKIFGWIGAVVGVVAAAIATVATGGAAAPALAVACLGLGMMILEETGAMEKIVDFLAENPAMLMVVFGPVVGGALFALSETGVLDEDKLKMAIQITMAVEMLVLSIASMVCTGGASAANSVGTVSKLFNCSTKTAQTVINGAKIAGQIGQGVGAATSVGGGAAGVASSVYGYQAAMANADSKEFVAWLAKIQSQMDEEQETLQAMIDQLNGDMKSGSEMLEGANATTGTIMANTTA